MGNVEASGNVTATFAFNTGVGGINLCDGLAYDPMNDTLWFSPDVDTNVYEFGLGGANPLGTLLNTVAPLNDVGEDDGLVSGVVVGAGNTLYVARNGAQEIRRIDKSDGSFISNFAQTAGRAEDLTCDTETYAPLTAILAKEFDIDVFQAFEVEPGTCIGPEPAPPPEPVPAMNPAALLALIALFAMVAYGVRRRTGLAG